MGQVPGPNLQGGGDFICWRCDLYNDEYAEADDDDIEIMDVDTTNDDDDEVVQVAYYCICDKDGCNGGLKK